MPKFFLLSGVRKVQNSSVRYPLDAHSFTHACIQAFLSSTQHLLRQAAVTQTRSCPLRSLVLLPERQRCE